MKKVMFTLVKVFIKNFSGRGFGKIPGAVRMSKFIYASTKPKGVVLINCQGNKIYVNTEDTGFVPDLLIRGAYEPFETKLLQSLLAKDMTVVNIGANIGYYTLIAAKRVGPNGKVYAFEPEPENYKLLVKNIEANGYKNVVPIQAAVSNKPGTLKLFLDKTNVGAPSFSERNIKAKNGYVEVEANSLDNFFEKYNKDFKADIIQMDTQGAEGLILDGAQKIISNNKLKIIMEFWPYGLKNMGTDPSGLLKKIESYGFKVRIIDEDNHCLSSLPSEKIVEMCINSKNGKGVVNLLLEK